MDSRTQFGNGSLLLATGTIVLAMTASVMMLTLPTPVTKSTSPERRQLDAATLRNARIRERYIEFLPESVETRRRPAERREQDRVTASNKSASMNQTELAQIQRQLSQLDSALSQIQQQQQMLVQQQMDSRKAALSQNSSSLPSSSASPQQFSMESAVREHTGVTATVQTVSSQSAASSHPESATHHASANAGSSETTRESASVTLEQASTSNGFSESLSPQVTSTTAESSGAQESAQGLTAELLESVERSGADSVGSDSNHDAEVTFPDFPQPEDSESSAPALQTESDEEFSLPFEPNADGENAESSSPDGEAPAGSDLSIPDSLMPADTEDSLEPVMIPAEQATSSSRLLRTLEDDIPFIAALGWSEDDAESLEMDELTIPRAEEPLLIRAVVTGPTAEMAAPLIERTNREQASTLPDVGEFWNTAMAEDHGIPSQELRPVPQDSSSFVSSLPADSSMSTASPAIFEYEYSPQLTYDTNFQSAPMESFPSTNSGVMPAQGPRNSANHSVKGRGLFRIPKFRFSGGSGQNQEIADSPVRASAASWSFGPHNHHDPGSGQPMASQYSPAPIVHRGVHSVSSWSSAGPGSRFATSPGNGLSDYPGMYFNDGFIEPGYYEAAPYAYSAPQPTVPYVMVPTIVMPDFDFGDFEMPEFSGQTFHRAYSAIRFASHSSAIP